MAWRKLTVLGEETLAIKRTHKLREEVELDVAVWCVDCAAAVLAPVRWILDTGAPEDLVSENSVGGQIIAKRIKNNADYRLNTPGGLSKQLKWKVPIKLRVVRGPYVVSRYVVSMPGAVFCWLLL